MIAQDRADDLARRAFMRLLEADAAERERRVAAAITGSAVVLPPGFRPEARRIVLPPGVHVPGYERREDE